MIIPIFIMNKGCPNRCVFCNLQKTAGDHPGQITEGQLRQTVASYIGSAKKKPDDIQLAFYGGNFTGLDGEEEIALLGYAKSLISEGLIHSIRVSTRPDYIDREQCDLLWSFGVTTVEIGAQSMVDEVLELSGRGHTSADTVRAVEMLRGWGFITGIHLMAGLPGDSRERFACTIDRSIGLKPAMVRLHPTIVFENTALAEAYGEGRYQPMSLAEAIDACKYALKKFSEAGIPVIRVGLQTTKEMEAAGSIVAGPFHPAFHALVEESIFYDMAFDLLSAQDVASKDVVLFVSPRYESYLRGQKNNNLKRLKERFRLNAITVKPDEALKWGTRIVNIR
ncbi:MAG: radical SAM protein [Deltaproteobacteria bacterium]|nr:radical SAM protein [Deltaproteobacteria bacterium]